MEATPQQVCQDMMFVLERVKRVAVALAEEKGLSRVQLFALYWIYHTGELAMGQMADMLVCDASNVTGLVDRMVTQGLVTRHDNEKDRRIKTLRLTPKAQRIIKDLQAMLPREIGCDRLTAAERQKLHSILQKIGPAFANNGAN